MDGPGHPLSLKVMRVSRPGLANAWQPFYSSSPSFSGHSTASIVSLQGKTPLPGHPKTLRDLTDPTELLTLPAAFGAIQLGETFSSCLCVNNEAHVNVEAVSLKVEMQTATSKTTLAEFGGMNHKLTAGDTDECLISHEIKELGQHVLACEVTYRTPQGMRQPASSEHADDLTLQTFRKFYKFVVTNPLSVKTKVHTSRSPTALLTLGERDKVFLEVHVQNMTQDPMHFEKIQLEGADGWIVEDPNFADLEAGQTEQGPNLFSGSMTLMQPHDIRQYIYMLTPKNPSIVAPVYPPGSSIPLGRLNILWRSSFGEPGRLLTSMLSRRIPISPALTQQPVSAVPPYLKRNPPSRPQSPQLGTSRPGSPRAHSVLPPVSPIQPILPPPPNLELNLLLREDPPRTVRLEVPMTISYRLVVTTSLPNDVSDSIRTIRLAIQHLQPPKIAAVPSSLVSAPSQAQDVYSPQPLSSGFSTPISSAPAFNYDLAKHKLLLASAARVQQKRALSEETVQADCDTDLVIYPAPNPTGLDELKGNPTGICYLGPSLTLLPPISLSPDNAIEDTITVVQPFDLTFLPLQKGYQTVGGLRVLLVEDRVDSVPTETTDRRRLPIQARTLKEWDVLSEMLVSS